MNIKQKITGAIVTFGVIITIVVAIIISISVTTALKKALYDDYSFRVGTMEMLLKGAYDELQATGMQDLYEKQAKEDVLKKIRSNYYTDSSINIYPFIVDHQGHMILHPTIESGSTVLADADFIKKAITQKNGDQEYVFKNIKKWMCFRTFDGWKWTVGYALPLKEIVAPAQRLTVWVVGVILVISLVLVIAIMIMVTRILKPLDKVSKTLFDIAQGAGDLTIRINIASNDEIGKLAESFNKFTEKLQGIIGQIVADSNTVAASATELSSVSAQIATHAEEMSTQTSTVASATEQATANINSVSSAAGVMSSSVQSAATAIEEMSASLNEVSSNCQKELKIAVEASAHAKNSKLVMDKLGAAAKSIGKVVDVINDLADQTNLLALNATIEAASAGDAGKGFVVVASEVKELAKQTAKATHEIQQQVEEIQTNTESAIKAIDAVSRVIEEVNTISHTIVSAVEEQSATVNEISKNVSEVSSGAKEVSKNVAESADGLTMVSSTIAGVNNAVSDTAKGIQQVNTSAGDLSKLSEGLNVLLRQFKI